MAVSQVAQSVMSPSTIDTVETIIAHLSREGPFADSPDMTQVACWADDLKSQGLVNMAGWHFVNLPYDPTGIAPKNPTADQDIMKVIDGLNNAAKRHQKNPQGWIVGFAIANLIHFYGDIHQPLHVTEMYTAEFPDGDKGGNKQQVICNGRYTNLHAVWDAVCFEYADDLVRPLIPRDKAIVEKFAQKLIATYNFTQAQQMVKNTTIMARESYEMAVSTAYPGVEQGKALPQWYLDKCIPAAESRLALAGYRLGHRLETLFKMHGHDERQFALHTLKYVAERQHELHDHAVAQRASRRTV